MVSRAYRATRVNDVDWDRLVRGNEGVGITLGIDVGKHDLWPVCRWDTGRFERPWRVKNPEEIPALVALIQQMSKDRKLVVAMESSGTYGDALRQALSDAKVAVLRVSNKASHDYAEIFDGVPSQHDGKDAAVIAELAGLGKAQPWGYEAPSEWDQELSYWVEWMVAQRRILTGWQGRLEALVARHWPEATRDLKLSSVTLLRALEHYGDPRTLAADPEAAERLCAGVGRSWQRRKPSGWWRRRGRAWVCGLGNGSGARSKNTPVKRWWHGSRSNVRNDGCASWPSGIRFCEAQGKAVGIATACVLWTCVGDPRNYHAAAAYRKAMGLNLKERSSGAYQGQLRISKRGSARARQWLYFAALRQSKD